MNRNVESHFSEVPQLVNVRRSTMKIPFNHRTSFNVGQLIPFYCMEILPGDSVKINTSKVARLQTMLTPIYDNLYLDTYYFFVPNRIVYEHWEELCGENKNGAWIPEVEYSTPVLKSVELEADAPNFPIE